jgi:RNA polymerase sigma factor for flagellar operon FliA
MSTLAPAAEQTADASDADWNEYARARSPEIRERLVKRYMPLVQMRARRLSRRIPDNVTFDDLCSAGYMGLLNAIESFSPGRNIQFESFSTKRIHGAMLDWLRGLDPLARTTRQFQRSVEQIRTSGAADGPMHDTDIAGRMGLSEKRYQTLERRARERTEVLFCACAQENEGSELGLDPVDAEQPDPSRSIAMQWLIERIKKETDLVGWTILRMYYFEHRTMQEIGRELNLSESRVSQIHTAVIKRLRQRLDKFGVFTEQS